jgi:hypothetical protein
VSRYADVESQFVARIQALVPDFNAVRAMAGFGLEQLDSFPAVVVTWTDTQRVGEPIIINQIVRVISKIRLAAYLYVKDAGGVPGGARLGTDGTYSLLDSLRAALIGFQPVVASAESVWPVVPGQAQEEFFLVEGGAAGIVTTWEFDAQFAQGAA